MNAYVRREEIRWTAFSAVMLVFCMGASVVRLVTVRGALVPDPAARAAAKAAEDRAVQAHGCAVAAERLSSELDVYKATAKAARLSPAAQPDAGAPRRGPRDKDKGPDADLAWRAAMPAYKQARALVPCRGLVEEAVGARPDNGSAWDAVGAAAALTPPPDGDKPAMIAAARTILALTEKPVPALADATRDAEATLKTAAARQHERAQSAFLREPPPSGLLSRGAATTLGLGIAVIALALSVASVRAAAMKRMVALVPLRDIKKIPTPGLHAAEVLRIATQPNGGEPGLVLGAAFGGLAAALAWPIDADVFVAGVMGGLVIGLSMQALVRIAVGMSAWRKRALALGEIEKPLIPIVLVLSGVPAGLEAKFVRFLMSLGTAEAAATVERMAADVETQILAAAEAGAGASGAPPGVPGGPRPHATAPLPFAQQQPAAAAPAPHRAGAYGPPQGPGPVAGYPAAPGQRPVAGYPVPPAQAPAPGYPPPGQAPVAGYPAQPASRPVAEYPPPPQPQRPMVPGGFGQPPPMGRPAGPAGPPAQPAPAPPQPPAGPLPPMPRPPGGGFSNR